MMEAHPRPRTGHVPTLAEDPALGLSQRAKLEILFAILLGAVPRRPRPDHRRARRCPRSSPTSSGNDLYTWVVTIYLLTCTITVPFYGKLSDLYGRKPLLMIGITLFLIGSALSGLSQKMGS